MSLEKEKELLKQIAMAIKRHVPADAIKERWYVFGDEIELPFDDKKLGAIGIIRENHCEVRTLVPFYDNCQDEATYPINDLGPGDIIGEFEWIAHNNMVPPPTEPWKPKWRVYAGIPTFYGKSVDTHNDGVFYQLWEDLARQKKEYKVRIGWFYPNELQSKVAKSELQALLGQLYIIRSIPYITTLQPETAQFRPMHGRRFTTKWNQPGFRLFSLTAKALQDQLQVLTPIENMEQLKAMGPWPKIPQWGKDLHDPNRWLIWVPAHLSQVKKVGILLPKFFLAKNNPKESQIQFPKNHGLSFTKTLRSVGSFFDRARDEMADFPISALRRSGCKRIVVTAAHGKSVELVQTLLSDSKDERQISWEEIGQILSINDHNELATKLGMPGRAAIWLFK